MEREREREREKDKYKYGGFSDDMMTTGFSLNISVREMVA